MLIDLKLNLKQSFNIKCAFDIVGFIVISTIFILLANKANMNTEFIIRYLVISTGVFLTLHYLSKQIVSITIKRSLSSQVYAIESTSTNIEETVTSQKKILEDFSSKSNSVTNIVGKLKSFSDAICNLTTEMDKIVTQSISCAKKENEINISNSEKIVSLKQKVQVISELILELSEHSHQISNTISVVDDIAEQTNLLALNAAVEAARAGEQGKGFAVVAGEIRKLADESKQAIIKISSLANNIQGTTNTTVMATEDGVKEIEGVLKESQQVTTNSKALSQLIDDITQALVDINKQIDKQNNIIEQLSLIDEDSKVFKDELNKIIEVNTSKLAKINELSTEIKNSAIEG